MASLALPIFRAVALVGGLLCRTELLLVQPASKSGQKVTLVGAETVAAPVQHGIGKRKLALGQKGALTAQSPYHAIIPVEDIPTGWDLMYFIEVMDKGGNGRIHSDLNREKPNFVVKLQR